MCPIYYEPDRRGITVSLQQNRSVIKKSALGTRLKAVVSVTARTVFSREFRVVEPAIDDDRSPSFILVRGIG